MRAKDITSIISHAEKRRQELLSLVFGAGITGGEVENIASLAGEILGNLTKCFDYCANDIYDAYLSHEFKGRKKPKVYFPFYLDQLTGEKVLFGKLKSQNEPLYQFLIKIAERADNSEFISEPLIKYSTAREVRKLVNEDKHDKIVEVDQMGPQNKFAQSDTSSVFGAVNNSDVEFLPDQDKTERTSKTYRFVANNEDVADFCSSAQFGTERLMEMIYSKFFGTSISPKK